MKNYINRFLGFHKKKSDKKSALNLKNELKIGGCLFSYHLARPLLHDNNGFTYHSNKYTSRYFRKERVEKVNDAIEICKDENGRSVIWIYEAVPTFDSGDREWNSYKELFVFKEKGGYTGIYLNGGYHLALARVYTNIEWLDDEMKGIFEKLSFHDKKHARGYYRISK